MEIAMKFAGTPPKMSIVNQAQAIFLRLCGKFLVFERLRDHFYGYPGLEPALFPFHPQLF